jgi:hypothetical protein
MRQEPFAQTWLGIGLQIFVVVVLLLLIWSR